MAALRWLTVLGLAGLCVGLGVTFFRSSRDPRTPDWREAIRTGKVIKLERPSGNLTERIKRGRSKSSAESNDFIVPPPPSIPEEGVTPPLKIQARPKVQHSRLSFKDAIATATQSQTIEKKDAHVGPAPPRQSERTVDSPLEPDAKTAAPETVIATLPSGLKVGASTKEKGQDSSLPTLERLVAAAHAKLASAAGFRAELVNEDVDATGQMRTERARLREDLRERMATLEWPDGPKRGRRVVIDRSRPEANLTIMLGPRETKAPEPPIIAPANHPLVASPGGRHPLPEWGPVGWASRFERMARGVAAGDGRFGAVAVVGPSQEPDANGQDLVLVRQATTGADRLADLPDGATREWHVSREDGLPRLIVEKSAEGKVIARRLVKKLEFSLTLAPDDASPGDEKPEPR